MTSACGGGMIPSCCPVSSITRTSRTRMRSLVRTRSSRLGERSNAITSSSGYDLPDTGFRLQATRRFPLFAPALASNFFQRVGNERVHRPWAQITTGPAAHGNRPVSSFPVARYEHVRNLLQLGLSDFIINLLLAIVQLHSHAGCR